MKPTTKNMALLSFMILISGCAQDTTKLTTALSDGVQAGMKTSMDKNSTNGSLKNSLVDGVQVGLKSALDDNSSKNDDDSSGNMTTTVIDGVANYLKSDKEKN